jgi:hypothetical protein
MADNSLKKGRYTKYSNKIGLYSNTKGSYVRNDTDVVLNFPFKDAVLEGGMSKEDKGREERFLHLEIDSKDIDTLEEPKVLTGFRYIDENGEHKLEASSSLEFFDSEGNLKQNLLIKGNNLLALHTLKSRLARKVKLIYIDPPYNTGNDGFKYNDNFNHSAWLAFMKNRLEVAKELLADDGSIYVQLDYNEVHYCKVLMDEIFGKNNFQREIIWHLNTSSGYKTMANNWTREHDTILYFSKGPEPFYKPQYREYGEEYKKRFKKADENGRLYRDDRPNGLRQYLDELKGIKVGDVWSDVMSFQQASTSGEYLKFDGQKPETLLARIIEASTDEGDIVLDYHLGTGSTAATAHKMRRRWIGIEQMDYIESIAKERLKKVVAGEQNGISKSVHWNGGDSFVYLELKKYNQEYIDRIMEATSLSELEELYVDMRNNAFLKFWFDRSQFEKDEDFRQLDLDGRKEVLADVLDENQLYLNYADMDDTRHKVTADEKALTDKFYGTNEN